MKNYKDFAIGLAKQAGKIMLANFTLGMKKEWKDDNSPLTVTDTTINKLVINSVKKKFPKHGVLGEEESYNQDREYLWVCDPVDGTMPFSTGYPVFVFSLALVIKGESVLGVIYDPFLDRMFVGEKRKGALLNNKKIHVSTQKQLGGKMMINIETNIMLSKARDLLSKKECIVLRLGSVTYASILVASGEFIGNMFEYNKPWDAAAAKVIVEEAGGKFTDLDGKEQRYDRPINGFIASNGFIHNELVKICASR
jgi:myo-inositol-1(or 4)-monophosphatase